MSAEELSKLSLRDNMVTTRAGAARAQTAPARQALSPSQSRSPSPSRPQSSNKSDSPTPSIIESAHGLKYTVSALDPVVRRRAKQGLMDDNRIKMKYCRLLDEDSNVYMFCLEDEVQIAMGGKYKVPKCTCGISEGGACKHIFWMLDQLASGLSDKFKSQTLEVTKDGSSIHNKKATDIIDNATLERIAGSLDWVLHEDIPEDEEIEEEIADMLSVFEPSDALPVEFKSAETRLLSEESRKYREFKNLLAQLATENIDFFSRLQDIVDSDFQANVFFKKINHRIGDAFQALDEWIENGPTTAPTEAYDIPNCAGTLKTLIKHVDDYYQQHENEGHATNDIAVRAAAALIRILDEVVCRRNHDAYTHVSWGIPPDDPKENNLFVCLIGDPTADDGLFVLDALKNVPPDVIVRNNLETLSNIAQNLSPHTTPRPFMELFRTITTDSRKRASSESGGSSSKRPMQ